MRCQTLIVAVAASLMHFSAHAQTRVFPQVFMWQDQPANYAFADPRFAPMISVPLFENYDGPYECYHDPDDAARVVRIKLLQAMSLDPSERWMLPDGSNVCIILPYFGHMLSSYTGCGTLPPDMRFKTDIDKLTPFPPQYADNAWDHPFLLNATDSGPMAEWMKAFVAALKSEVITHNLPDPNNYRFYFDTEAHVSTEGSLPSVYMLWHLFHQRPDIWTGWKVPGSPGWQPHTDHATNPTGQTLAQMYADMVVATAATPDPTDDWPVDFTDVINTDLLPQDPDNLPYMVWFYSICDRAEDAVMRASAYDVLRASDTGWPFVRVGNYNAARFDGLTDPMPTVRPSSTWFADKSTWAPTLDPASPGNWSWTVTPTLTRQMPRAWFDPQPSATLMNTCNVSDRWLTLRRWASGTACSPELYPLSTIQWEGRPWVGQKGHWSLNPYVPVELQHPALGAFPSWPANGAWSPLDETKAQTRLRIQRHAVESVINANGGRHEARLAPWVNQFILVSTDPTHYRTAEREHRIMLAMLRAKNVPELIMWFPEGWDPLEVPIAIEVQTKGWEATQELVRRVWGTRVRDVRAIVGEANWQCPPVGNPPPYTCPLPTAQECATAVEFTLPDVGGSDFLFPIEATNEKETIAEFIVEIDPDYQVGHDFEVNLECFIPQAAVGELSVRSPTTGTFSSVPALEQGGSPSYFFTSNTAPFQSSPDGLYPIRRTFVIHLGNMKVHEASMAYPFPHLVLRCRVDVTYASRPQAYYDLVQVVPVRQLFIGTEEEEGYAVSDVTMDGHSDERDLLEFVGGYTSGHPVADINFDGTVDSSDLAAFLTSFTAP